MSIHLSPNPLQYDYLISHLQGYIEHRRSGKMKGYCYSYGPRKIEINNAMKGIGMIINSKQVLLFTPEVTYTFERYCSEEESFQASCTGEVGCDENIEKLINECVEIHFYCIRKSLGIGGWDGDIRC